MNLEHSGVPLRRRVLVAILAVTALAVILFALPLGIAVQRLYRTEAVTALQRDAARAAAVVPDTIPGGPVSLPRPSPSQPVIGVYDTASRRVAGSGPVRSALAASGQKTQVRRDTVENGDLAVVAPIPIRPEGGRDGPGGRPVPDRHRSGAPGVGGHGPARPHRHRSGGGAGPAAVRPPGRAARTPHPRRRALGDGDFTVRAERWACAKRIPRAGPWRTPAAQLGDLLGRERAFSSDVSHQLRTPLTALMVGLEGALDRPDADLRSAIRDALSRGEHLSTTINDLTSLVRPPAGTAAPADLAGLVRDVGARWEATAGRAGTAARSRRPGLTCPRAWRRRRRCGRSSTS